MQKPYDLKDLGERLKQKGLVHAEDASKDVYETVKEWYVDSAKLSATPIDDMGIPFIGYVDGIVYPQLDKIDGVEG